nr:uncharacterized protein LOC129454124 [Misgurnus anguillicaudatus]
MSGSVKDDIDKSSIMDSGEIEERIVDIYITAEAVRDLKHKKEVEDFNITTTKPTEPTGSECVMNRSYRSVTVCLVLLCVLLLTAVIVLCVLIITINHQFHITSKNITEERDQLLTKYTNITKERDQLLTNNTNLIKERDQLLTNNTNLTKDRVQLLLNNKNLTTENDRLLTNLNKQREQLNATMEILKRDGLAVFQSSLYFISSDMKTWSDSRTNCTQRGADLIIINNQEEQDFFKNMPGIHWIGLSDSVVEDRWKWVDGTTMTTSFWDKSTNEPNGGTKENCAVTSSSGWIDYSCSNTYKWIFKSLAATDHSALICLSPRAPTCIYPDKMQAEHPALWSPSEKHKSKRPAASDLEVVGENVTTLLPFPMEAQLKNFCSVLLLAENCRPNCRTPPPQASMERLDTGTCALPSLKKAWRVIDSAELCLPYLPLSPVHTLGLKTTGSGYIVIVVNSKMYKNMDKIIDKSTTMDRGEKEERIDDIYINEEAARYLKHKKEMKESNRTTTKPSEHTGSECVMKRGYRSVTVCLLLLCVLLLTAVIVLLINTNNHQSHITSRNITDERDKLLTKYKEERDQLLTKYTNITKERDQLLLNNKNLTTENDRLLTNLNKQREQLNATMEILKRDGLTVFQSSLYFISSEKKTWNESRTNCTQRGADLIIINNKEEQDFFKNMPGIHWIGLSDSDVEGTWKWVDGSTLNTSFSFWDKSVNEPNGGTKENCAVTYSSGWIDYSCTNTYKWICEKNFV